MAKFADLVRAQRESGKGVIGSLSGAYNQQNMQKFDVRNKLFSRSGLATALFPGLKGYQAQPLSNKASGSMISPALGNSPTALSSIAKDARISARNSMALPSIARNMAKMVKIWGGTPSKYFDSAAEKENAKEAKFGRGGRGGGNLGKGPTGGGGGIMGMLGGVGSMLGSAAGGLASVAGSILGGIGSLVGGAASGIFGVLSSALGGMGFVGILAAGAIGFVLYQIWKSLDFSKLGGGLGDAFSGIRESLSKIFGDVDNATGGKLGKFVDDVKDAFMKVTIRVSAAVETATELLMKLGAGVLKDFSGYFENFFQENKGKIFALMAIGMMGPRALMTLPGAAITAIAAAVGAATGEVDLDTMKRQREEKFKDLENYKKTGQMNIQSDADASDIANYEKNLKRDIGELDKKIQEKSERTTNTQSAINNFSAENVSSLYDTKVQEKMAAAGMSSGSNSPTAVSGANLLDLIAKGEASAAGYDSANRGKAGDTPKGIPGLSKMTVGEVMALQAKGELFAAGRYQIIPKTLAGLVQSGIVKPGDTFSPVIQDKLAMELVNRRLKAAGSDSIKQQFELSKEFASIENPYTGKSYHEGKGNNKASISTNQIQLALRGNGSAPSGGGGGGSSTPEPTRTASGGTSSGGTSSGGTSLMASLAEPLQQLDKFLGGALGLGSVNVSDMLRDLSMESKENPMFIDNSNKNINNGSAPDSSSVAASTWNKDILDAIIGRQTA